MAEGSRWDSPAVDESIFAVTGKYRQAGDVRVLALDQHSAW
jgi:hypothetical protein